jgi:hypothetical protein
VIDFALGVREYGRQGDVTWEWRLEYENTALLSDF